MGQESPYPTGHAILFLYNFEGDRAGRTDNSFTKHLMSLPDGSVDSGQATA